MRFQFLIAITLLVAICACVAQTPSDQHPRVVNADDISEISLTRLGGDGEPADVVTFFADGSATYEGKHNVERIGQFKGKLPDRFFNKTFPLLAKPFAELATNGFSFGKPTSGLVPVQLHIKWTGGVWEIEDHCPGLDDRAWACEMIARGLAGEIAWTK